jgi:isochorismate synthase
MKVNQTAASAGMTADELLGLYDQQTSFCFSSQLRTILCEGPQTALSLPDSENLTAALHLLRNGASRNGHDSPLLVGAIPFDRHQKPHLMISQSQQNAHLSAERGGNVPQSEPARPRSHYRYAGGAGKEEHECFVRAVADALEKIRGGRLSKVVLSRTLDLEACGPGDLSALIRRMFLKKTGAYCFAVRLGREQAGAASTAEFPVFFGASPELLLAKQGARVVSNPLAGSAPRSADPTMDRRRAEALLRSAKDRLEHKIVVDEIASALSPWCRGLTVPSAPSLVQTPTMWHLSSRIHGRARDPSISSLELAQLLHPTPAVCGQPTALACDEIARLERAQRGFFTGFVGWCDAFGNGEWTVAIRCAEATSTRARLYAGAGIVAVSDPEEEWLETTAKLATVLEVFNLTLSDLAAEGAQS